MPSIEAFLSSPPRSARRARWLSPDEEREARKQRQCVLHALEKRMQMRPVAAEADAAIQRVYAAELLFHRRLELWRFDYTAGVNLPRLSADLREVIRAYSLWRWLFDRLSSRRDPSTALQAPGDLRDAVHYCDFLHLLSLCTLFGLEDRIPALIEPQLNRAGMDVLLAALAQLPLTDVSGKPRWPDAPLAYHTLQRALLAPDPAGDRQAIEAYCAECAKAHAGALAHAHVDAQARGDKALAALSAAPSSHWAFEAAALCMRGNACIEADFWPKDLAWVRNDVWMVPNLQRRSSDASDVIAPVASSIPLQTRVKTNVVLDREVSAAVAGGLAFGDAARATMPIQEAAPPASVVESAWAGPGSQKWPTASGEREWQGLAGAPRSGG
ncbi:hypothetical protein BH11PSE8_BH11PSE8_29240 [soil metagenome]